MRLSLDLQSYYVVSVRVFSQYLILNKIRIYCIPFLLDEGPITLSELEMGTANSLSAEH